MSNATTESRIEWTADNGLTAAIVVSLARVEDTVGRDDWTGEDVTRDRGLNIRYEGWVEGHGVIDQGITRCGPMVPADCAAITAGGKMGIPADVLERIDAAADELRGHPEYVAQEERHEEMEAFEARREALRRKMDDDAYART